MAHYRPRRILVHEHSWQDPATYEILDRLPGVETTTVRSMRDVGSQTPELNGMSCPEKHGKNTLVLMRFLGKFVKACPGAGAEICCNCFIVNYAWNCHLGCTYCILQSYLDSRALIVFTNIEQLLAEVRGVLARSPERVFRIGTGELADSLALDHITAFSERLVPFFGSISNAILELKTKSDQVSNLQGLEHRGHTIVSWSVNSTRICRTEELNAPALEERLAAARKCQEWGYRLGFHFDPLILYPGWESDYREAVRQIFRTVDQGRVAWISLGALRFTPHLRDLVRRRFPKSKIVYGEFVPGHHGKLRYFRPIREEMYRKMLGWIREEAPKVFVYLCMESGVVWKRSLGELPGDAGLACRMDQAAVGGFSNISSELADETLQGHRTANLGKREKE